MNMKTSIVLITCLATLNACCQTAGPPADPPEKPAPLAAPEVEQVRRLVGVITGSTPAAGTGDAQLQDAAWTSYRLAELLPDPRARQRLLQMDAARDRIACVNRMFSPAGSAA